MTVAPQTKFCDITANIWNFYENKRMIYLGVLNKIMHGYSSPITAVKLVHNNNNDNNNNNSIKQQFIDIIRCQKSLQGRLTVLATCGLPGVTTYYTREGKHMRVKQVLQGRLCRRSSDVQRQTVPCNRDQRQRMPSCQVGIRCMERGGHQCGQQST